MNGYVEIVLRRNRGWPWPDDSWGLTPMFGEDGWCPACGVPKHSQTGPVILQRSGLKVEGGWVPYWRYDVYCLATAAADEAAVRFGLRFRQVGAPKGGDLGARQICIESSADRWFDQADLARIITPIHGESSETCDVCGVVRWLPVGMGVLPPPPASVLANSPAVIASPEWFGSGMQSFRRVIWRRDVAEFLVSVSPRDFEIQEFGAGGVRR